MSNSSEKSTSGGVSIIGLLGVAFIVLKLCHVINWSWWWVLSPFWGVFAAFILFFVIIGIIALIASFGDR